MAKALLIKELSAEEAVMFADLVEGHPMFLAYGITAEKLRLTLPSAAQRGEVLLGAYLNGQPTGLCHLLLKGAFGASGYIKLVMVRHGVTSAGVGAALMDAAEQSVRQQSRHMFLLVNESNTRAQEFYRKRGYEHAGTLPDFAAPGEVELIFHKTLSE